MSDFMSKGDVRHLGRHMGTIILHGDDTSVQRLSLPIRVEFALFTNPPGTSCGGGRKNKRTVSIIKLSNHPNDVVQEITSFYDHRYVMNS